jgi:prepilin-type N-terminal cleavage/methylation domain-containing protein
VDCCIKALMRIIGDTKSRGSGPERARGAAGAFTLIEVIAVMAVIAILGVMLLPAITAETDKPVADKEIATLRSFGDALQQYVVASRTIPDETAWYTNVSSRLGVSPNDVLYNPRQQSHAQSRVYLIDPSMQLGLPASPTPLPYYQSNFVSTATATPMLPQNPRVMIVSSLGKPLPISSGVFGTTANGYFADLWNAAIGTVPNDAAWTGWTGNPADLVIQRIDLTPLFVPVQLITDNSSVNYGYFTIDGLGTPLPAYKSTNDFTHYFIQGSVLSLYNDVSTLDTRLIINGAGSFIFQNGVWRSNGNGSGGGPGVMDLGAVVQQFVNATPNVNAQNPSGNAQQALIVSDMLNYMKNYNTWAAAGYPSPSAQKTSLVSIQNTMMSDIAGIYSGAGGAYFPANSSSCP